MNILGSSFVNVGGPIPPQITLRSFSSPPVTGELENDLRVTWGGMGPPTFPKDEPRISMVGPWEILDESIRDPERRSRAMSIFALEINGNERVGSLRFSLWKPSPFLVLLLWHQPTASEFHNITLSRPVSCGNTAAPSRATRLNGGRDRSKGSAHEGAGATSHRMVTRFTYA